MKQAVFSPISAVPGATCFGGWGATCHRTRGMCIGFVCAGCIDISQAQTHATSTVTCGTRTLRYLTLLFCILVLAACEQKSQPTTTTKPATTQAQQPAKITKRIVCLAPSITQMVIALGYGDWIVGTAEHDTLAPTSAPVVGTFLEPDSERLLSVKPDLVITVTGKRGVPKKLTELASASGFEIASYPFPESVASIREILAGDGEISTTSPSSSPPISRPSLGTVLGCEAQARALAASMMHQLAQIQRICASDNRPKVLIVISTNPIMASGQGTVLDELLHIAGGNNAAGDSPVHAPTFDRESLLALAPDVLVYTLPDSPPLGSMTTDVRLADLRGLTIPAITNQRICLINDPLVHLQGTNVVRITAQIAKAIHPQFSAEIDQAIAAKP